MTSEREFSDRRKFIRAGIIAGLSTLAIAPYSRPAAAHSRNLVNLLAIIASTSRAASETALSAAENQRSLVEEMSSQGDVSQEAERLMDNQFLILGQLTQALTDMDKLLNEVTKVVDQDCG